jgi:hypothetical protein
MIVAGGNGQRRMRSLEARNDNLNVEIRRNRGLLITTSNGIFLFGIWSIIKACLSLIMDTEGLVSKMISETESKLLSIGALTVIVAIITIIDLSFRLTVWNKARREADGIKKSSFLVFVTVMMILGSTLQIINDIRIIIVGDDDRFQAAVSFIIEITSCILTTELLIAVFRLRRLRSEANAENIEESI